MTTRPKTLREIADRSESLGDFGRNLRDWLHELRHVSSRIQAMAAISDEPPSLRDRFLRGFVADAWLGAYAEQVAGKIGSEAPGWAFAASRIAEDPIFDEGADSPKLRALALQHAPFAFKRRNIYSPSIDLPLFLRAGRPLKSPEEKRKANAERQRRFRKSRSQELTMLRLIAHRRSRHADSGFTEAFTRFQVGDVAHLYNEGSGCLFNLQLLHSVMGPTAVFDKSFIQTLTVDESVWFDHHFVPVITPLFFVETLADLEKEKIRAGRTPEDEVRIIAEKVPEMNSVPHLHHVTLCEGELLGFHVPFQGRPVLAGGVRTQVGDKKGIVYGVSPEAEALERWRREEYWEVERRFAKSWRRALAAPKGSVGERFIERYRGDADDCTTREQLQALARSIVHDSKGSPAERIGFVFEILGLHENRDGIFERFRLCGAPSIAVHAPYTGHVLEVELFVRFCMQRGIIAKERASNWVDIAYLYYLPTCHVFVSNDRLHRDNAPLFLRGYQTFVWGEDLKVDLKRINELRKGLPQDVRDRGLMNFALRPPTEGDFLTARLWDLAMKPSWRTPRPIELSEEAQKKIIESMKTLKKKAKTQTGSAPLFTTEEADSITIERRIKMRKGSWTQLSPDVLGPKS